jgi:hypothetical protein
MQNDKGIASLFDKGIASLFDTGMVALSCSLLLCKEAVVSR